MATRFWALAGIAIGVGAYWYNGYLLANEQAFHLHLLILGPMGILGGLFMLMFPAWAGALTPGSTREQRRAAHFLLAAILVASAAGYWFVTRRLS